MGVDRGQEMYDRTLLAKYPDPSSDDYIRAFVCKNAITVYHPTGTTRMGPVQDKTTVVDNHLRVYTVLLITVRDHLKKVMKRMKDLT